LDKELLSSYFNKKNIFILISTSTCIYIIKRYLNGPTNQYHPNLDGKIIIITGANTGIGF